MSDTFSRIEIIPGVARRRRFATEQKLSVVAETMQPGMSISYVARRHGLSPSLVFRWRRLMTEGGQELFALMRRSCMLRMSASSRKGSANSSAGSVARHSRSRSSRRPSTPIAQKK
jgi:transposase